MNCIKTGILLAALTMLLVWAGSLIGGPQGAVIALVFALIVNGVSYWYSDRIVLTLYKAYELPESKFYHLYNIVRGLAKNAGLPMPKICMVESKSPNAFATGRSPEKAVLCVTRGLLELLSEKELRGVLSHELSHVKNRDTLIMTVTAAIAGAVMMLASMARWAALLGGYSRDKRGAGNVISLLAVSIVAPLAAVIVQLAISRSREYVADKNGAEISGDPYALATALKRLESAAKSRPMKEAPPQTAHLFIINPFSGGFIAGIFSTHPPIAERIRRLEAMKV